VGGDKKDKGPAWQGLKQGGIRLVVAVYTAYCTCGAVSQAPEGEQVNYRPLWLFCQARKPQNVNNRLLDCSKVFWANGFLMVHSFACGRVLSYPDTIEPVKSHGSY